MARFLAQKHLGALRPADDAGCEALRKIGNGQIVSVEIKQSRNIKHHRMFWALMSIVHDNMDHERYPTVEDLVAAVKIYAGLRTRIELPNGTVGFIPGSLAFAKMDQTAFDAFYDQVCDLIAKHFLPGISSDALRAEVEIMTGVRS
jgi:hypothetical protein